MQAGGESCQRAKIELDLRDFSPAIHKAIVFDEASASQATMPSSATNMYSYMVWVYGCMFIVTSNHWERDIAELSEEDANWLRGNWVCGTNSFFRVAMAWMAIFWEATAVNVAQRRQELRVLCEWDLAGIWPEMAWFGKPGCGACT